MTSIARSIDANWAAGLPEPEHRVPDFRGLCKPWERGVDWGTPTVAYGIGLYVDSDPPRISRGVQLRLSEVQP